MIPNQSIVTVNATGIAQDAYRKDLAFQGQVLWNQLQSELKQQADASAKAQAGDATAAAKNQALISQIQADEANYAAASIQQTAVDRLVEELCGFPPLAQRSAKKLLNDIEDANLSLAIELEGQAYGRLRSSDDFREGVEAFDQKRRPKFTGR